MGVGGGESQGRADYTFKEKLAPQQSELQRQRQQRTEDTEAKVILRSSIMVKWLKTMGSEAKTSKLESWPWLLLTRHEPG